MKLVIVPFGAVSLTTLVIGVLVLEYHSHLVHIQIVTSSIPREDAPKSLKRWKNTPSDPLTVKVILYDHARKLDEGEKVKEIGPFILSVRKVKKRILFPDNDHVSYQEFTSYQLDRSETSQELQRLWEREESITTFVVEGDEVHSKLTSPHQVLFGDGYGYFVNNSRSGTITINNGYSNHSRFGVIESYESTPITIPDSKVLVADGYLFPCVSEHSSLGYFHLNSESVVPLTFKESLQLENGVKVLKFVQTAKGDSEDTMFLIEPLSGRVVNSKKRFLVTLNEVIPILRYDELLLPSKKTLNDLERYVNYKLKVMHSIGGYFMVASVVSFLLAVFTYKRLWKKRGVMDFMMKPIIHREERQEAEVSEEPT